MKRLVPLVLTLALAVTACRPHESPNAAANTAQSVDDKLRDPDTVRVLLGDAAREDDADTIHSLVRRGVDIDMDIGGRTALTLAAYHRSPSAVDALFETLRGGCPRRGGLSTCGASRSGQARDRRSRLGREESSRRGWSLALLLDVEPAA